MQWIRKWRGVSVALLAGVWLTGSAQAWQPPGWTYWDWPWSYDSGSGDWHWFTSSDTQWIYAYPPGSGWAKLPQSGIGSGWSYWAGDWAYDGDNGAWCWRNTGDAQWCVNMRTGQWSLLGHAPAMVLISGGTNAGTDPDYGAYSLTVASFYMDRFEVTKALWDDVYTWAIAHGYSFDHAGAGRATDHPVQTVNWYDCVKWCNARSEKEGRIPCYNLSTWSCNFAANGFRLPTTTEWEYAARGGASSKRFPWGDRISHAKANYFSVWLSGVPSAPFDDGYAGFGTEYATGGTPFTSPAGAFAANGYGLCDMSGNVWEWCNDVSGSERAMRGGGWESSAHGARCGGLGWSTPDRANNEHGFRAVCR